MTTRSLQGAACSSMGSASQSRGAAGSAHRSSTKQLALELLRLPAHTEQLFYTVPRALSLDALTCIPCAGIGRAVGKGLATEAPIWLL